MCIFKFCVNALVKVNLLDVISRPKNGFLKMTTKTHFDIKFDKKILNINMIDMFD